MRETNVRISKVAKVKLWEIASARGESHDAAARGLLMEFIKVNEALPCDDRVTHISTVMRYPDPYDELERTLRSRVRLRLPEGKSKIVRSLAFRVPGQTANRGNPEYQARLLADALMTSITMACEEIGLAPIDEPVFRGLQQLLRHKAARGLWSLAVESTRARAEINLLEEAAEVRDRRELGLTRGLPGEEPELVERAATMLDAEATRVGATAWLSVTRFGRVRRLAHEFLELSDQRVPGSVEEALYRRNGAIWESMEDSAHQLLVTTRTAVTTLDRDEWAAHVSNEGRGGGAVWKAFRNVAVSDLVDWLARSSRSDSSRAHAVTVPGWKLIVPPSWVPFFWPGTPSDLGEEWIARVSANEVLHFDLGKSQMLWPTTDTSGTNVTVEGLGAVLSRLHKRLEIPALMAEALLMELMPGDANDARRWGARGAGLEALWGQPHIAPRSDGSLQQFDEPMCGPEVSDADASDGMWRLSGDAAEFGQCNTSFDENVNWELDVLAVGDNDEEPYAGVGRTFQMFPVLVPVHRARALGFIDASHARRLVEAAKLENDRRMQDVIALARRRGQSRLASSLISAMKDPTRFRSVAGDADIEFRVAMPVWGWHVRSLAHELTMESRIDRREWLATYVAENHARVTASARMEAVRHAAARFAYLHRP